MATITSGSRTGGGKTFTVGDTVYFTNYSTTLNGSAGSNSGYTMPWHGKITQLYDTTYTNWIYTTNNTDAAGKTSSYTMLIRPSWCTKGYKITVTYNKNGGSSGTASQTGYVGTSLTGTAARTGYAFAGWYTAASGGSKVTTIPSSATTYYAHWTAKAITIVYNANGGSGTMANSTGSYGTAITLRANTFTHSGYTFSGWATSATGAKVYNNQQSVTNINTGGTTTLYAVWVSNPATITFNGNGADEPDNYTQSLSQATSTFLSPNVFIKTGYYFKGWAEAADGPVVYINQQSITIPSGTTAKTLYAIWLPNIYNVVYKKDSYETLDLMALQSFTYDLSQNLLKNHFRKKGYIFSGWCKPQLFERRISQEDNDSIITLKYLLEDNEYFVSVSCGVLEDGVENESAFTIISKPYYNPISRTVYVIGQGTSTALLKLCYLKVKTRKYIYNKLLSFDFILSSLPDIDMTLDCNLLYNDNFITSFKVTKENFYENSNNEWLADFIMPVPIECNDLSNFIVDSLASYNWWSFNSLNLNPLNSNIYTDEELVSNLTTENLTIFLYPLWTEDSNYDSSLDEHLSHINTYDDIIYYLGSNVYPIGSIYISNETEEVNGVITAKSPASKIGGLWLLIRKQFIPKVFTNQGITFNTTNTQSGTSWIYRNPNYLDIQASWYPKVAHADTTLTIATFDLATLGLNGMYTVRNVAVNDGYNCCGMVQIADSNNTKIIRIDDVIGTDTTASFGPGTSGFFQARFYTMVNMDHMLDSHCDRFYWLRIK